MLNLDANIKLDAEAIAAPNLCERFSKEDLRRIGEEVWEGYEADEKSRTLWKKRVESSMDLAMQIQKDKNWPWPNCSNVAFPLVTIAVLQFHARAYPEIIQGTDVVRCRVIGSDADGKKTARALRVSTHMSYQVLEEDVSWEEQHDRLLIQLGVVGCNFIKTYQDPDRQHSVSELVSAKNLVLNYYAKSVEDCPRKTQIITMQRNDVHTRVMRGTFRDILDESWYLTGSAAITTQEQANSDNRSGTRPPTQDATTPLTLLEQHCALDLDGDHYAEPYVITIDKDSKEVLRIVTRFDREEDIIRVKNGRRAGAIVKINPMEYFTKFGFIPSPDGGVYDLGFGSLVGPLNEASNSLINQLIDAGTMANSGGGFLGRGAKIRGGVYTFAPFEWKRLDSTSDDIRKSLYPLEIREPAAVLFQLLSFLVNYTNRISGSTDTMVGENPGQNTPAETTRTMVEQGAKIYAAIFKRVWRSMREEFKKRYILNGLFLPDRVSFGSGEDYAQREDYLGSPAEIVPAADPHVATKEERIRRAVLLKQTAMVTPGYSLPEIEKRFLQANEVEGIAVIYPGPDKVPPLPNPKMMIEQEKTSREKLKLQASQMLFVMELEETKKLNEAKIVELKAKAAEHLANAEGVESGHAIAAFEASIGALKQHNETLDRQRKMMLEGMKNESESADKGPNSGGVPRVAGPPGDASLSGLAGGMEGGPP